MPVHRLLLATSLLGCLPLLAGSTIPGVAASAAPDSTATGLLLGKFPGASAYDRIWSAFTLYKDEDNQVLEEFALQGRLQLQYADGHSNDGHFDIQDFKNGSAANRQSVFGDRFEDRRTQFGFKSKWFQNWKLDGQIDVDVTDGASNLYRDIYDLYLTYAPSDKLNISLGKREVTLGREYEISSKEILTFERSMVTGALFVGNLTGAWVQGKGLADHWLYEAGIYSNDRVREFSDFNHGIITSGKIGYDYSDNLHLDTAVVSLQYLHNSEPGYRGHDDGVYFASASPAFTDSIALSNEMTQGRFGLTTDILYGFGYQGRAEQSGVTKTLNQSDLFGITIIPSYFIADGLQLVGRLQFATATDPNGLSLPGRYEAFSQTTDKKGNTYTSLYAGLNYYLYGHKLKLMNGIEYSHLGGGDYDGYTFLSGLRFSF